MEFVYSPLLSAFLANKSSDGLLPNGQPQQAGPAVNGNIAGESSSDSSGGGVLLDPPNQPREVPSPTSSTEDLSSREHSSGDLLKASVLTVLQILILLLPLEG